MITPDYARMMAAYNAEVNRHILAAAGRLPDAVHRADGGAFWRSMHGTLSHVLWADRAWLARFGAGPMPQAGLKDSDKIAAEFEDLRAQRQDLDEVILRWADSLVPADLLGDVTWWSMATDRMMARPKTLAVVHLFNHQTHHRGQVHALLTRAGEATGDTDLTLVPL